MDPIGDCLVDDVLDCFRVPIIILRDPDGAEEIDQSTGLYIRKNTEQIETEQVVQPASTNDMKLLPENDRLEAAIVVWSDIEIFGTSEKTQKVADIIVYQGDQYRVRFARARPTGSYWRTLCTYYRPHYNDNQP